jgi:hypothetical protein
VSHLQKKVGDYRGGRAGQQGGIDKNVTACFNKGNLLTAVNEKRSEFRFSSSKGCISPNLAQMPEPRVEPFTPLFCFESRAGEASVKVTRIRNSAVHGSPGSRLHPTQFQWLQSDLPEPIRQWVYESGCRPRSLSSVCKRFCCTGVTMSRRSLSR